jgi:Tol biopolymer transport system component
MLHGIVRITALSILWIALAAGPRASEPRVVWAGPDVTLLGGPSRDGRFLSFVDPISGNLAIRNLSSGAVRTLTSKPPGSKEFAYFSAISPDSAQVAYAWFNDEGYYDLRVIGLDGSNPRVLFHNEEAGFVQPCAWTPDGNQILTLFFRSDNISQIALVPAEGGPPKILRSLNWVYPKRMDISPDGRFIVYDSFAKADTGDRSIYLLAVDGTRETRLIDSPGSHLFPLWTPDGRSVIYASDRSGTMDLWALEIRDGKRNGEPRVLRRDAGRVLPMGFTHEGDYYYGVRSGETDVFVTTLENPAGDARRATLRFPGRNTAPAWSPDGKSLAYLSRRGSENFGQESRSIVIRSLEPDQERELQPKLAHLERLRWSPDGDSLLVSGSDNKGRAGLYIVNAKSAAVIPVVAEPGAAFRGFEGVWSKNGKSIIYIHGDVTVRSKTLDGQEAELYRGVHLRHLTPSPDGRSIAFTEGGDSIVILPLAGGSRRAIPFTGVTELHWGADLIAAHGAELWIVALDGATPRKLPAPGNREPGFSLHPDGKQIAVTAGRAQSEVRVMRISGP